MNHKTKRLPRSLKVLFLFSLYVSIGQQSFAQTSYIAVDSSLYYMDFDSKAYTLMMEFPFIVDNLSFDDNGYLNGTIPRYGAGPLTITIDPFDSSYTTGNSPSSHLTFINDSMAYVGTTENLLLYNVNTEESSILESSRHANYRELVFDSKSNKLFVIATRYATIDNITVSIDLMLIFEDDQLIHESDVDLSNIREIHLDESGNLYALDWQYLYRINKADGSFEDAVLNMEDYFEGFHHSIAFVNRSQNPNQLFTTEADLILGTIPLSKELERKFNIVNFSDEPWVFNGADFVSDNLEISFNYPSGSFINDYLEITIQLEKHIEEHNLDEISITWNDSNTFIMNLESEVLEYQKVQENEVYLLLRNGTILRLGKNYDYLSATSTGLFPITQITIDQSGYLHVVYKGDVYLADWKTGTLLKELSTGNKAIGQVFFGESKTYFWEQGYCGSTRQIWDEKMEALYEFNYVEGAESICVTSAVLKEGTEEFYLVSGMEKLYRLDLSLENPRLEFLMEYRSFSNLHFDDTGHLRAIGSSENQHQILRISEDFTTVEVIKESSYLSDLEITNLTALPPSNLLVLNSLNSPSKVSEIQIYPNPIRDEFALQNLVHQVSSAEFYSYSGHFIQDLKIPVDLNANFKIDKDLVPGIYLLKVVLEDGNTEILKVIKSNN